MAHARNPRKTRPQGWLRGLLILLFCLHLGNTGLPGVSIHHSDAAGVKHCNCGCDCSGHPDAPASCLNPRNTGELDCGCRKQHTRVFELPAPGFSPVLLPAPVAPLPAPRIQTWSRVAAPRYVSRPQDPAPSPPS